MSVWSTLSEIVQSVGDVHCCGGRGPGAARLSGIFWKQQAHRTWVCCGEQRCGAGGDSGVTTPGSLLAAASNVVSWGSENRSNAVSWGSENRRNAVNWGSENRRNAVNWGSENRSNAVNWGSENRSNAVNWGSENRSNAVSWGSENRRNAVNWGSENRRNAVNWGSENRSNAVNWGSENRSNAVNWGSENRSNAVNWGSENRSNAVSWGSENRSNAAMQKYQQSELTPASGQSRWNAAKLIRQDYFTKHVNIIAGLLISQTWRHRPDITDLTSLLWSRRRISVALDMRTLLDRNNISSITNGQVAVRQETGLIIKRLWLYITSVLLLWRIWRATDVPEPLTTWRIPEWPWEVNKGLPI